MQRRTGTECFDLLGEPCWQRLWAVAALAGSRQHPHWAFAALAGGVNLPVAALAANERAHLGLRHAHVAAPAVLASIRCQAYMYAAELLCVGSTGTSGTVADG